MSNLQSSHIMGAAFGFASVCCFSLNDVGIKFLSGGYPLHQVVLIRSMIGLAVFLAVIAPFHFGKPLFRSQRPWKLILRGLCAVFANMAFFLGLAALPIADAVAIFFVSPLVISVMSVFILGETVGPRRWAAIAIGLIGVLIVIRPGTDVFQIASLLPICAAIGYGYLHMITRQVRETESAATMTLYTLFVFITVSVVIGLALGHGRFDGYAHESLTFLLRAWHWPELSDMWVFGLIGVASMAGGMFVSQAFRLSDAAFIAPMEYVAMPLALFWGVVVFDTWPDGLALFGMVLIVGSGLFLVFREAQIARRENI